MTTEKLHNYEQENHGTCEELNFILDLKKTVSVKFNKITTR